MIIACIAYGLVFIGMTASCIYYKKKMYKYKGKYEYQYDEYWRCIDACKNMGAEDAVNEIIRRFEDIPF